jgi:dephospho-CoA kinase
MKVIGISGQTGAGKSTLSKMMSEQGLGKNIEVDAIGHKMLKDNSIKKQLIEVFGKEILDESGFICRKKLGRIAFVDSASIKQLNSIMHPAMVERVKKIIKSECQKKSSHLIINAALLFSMGLNKLCDRLVYVVTSPKIRLRRLTQNRAWTEERARERLFAQDDLPENHSDIIIVDNNGTEDELLQQAQKLADILR